MRWDCVGIGGGIVGLACARGLARRYPTARLLLFVWALQEMVPEVRAEDLEEAPSGVRAQAVTPQGHLGVHAHPWPGSPARVQRSFSGSHRS
ncbi:MAG: hypothetical protein AB1758_16890 [Candidatus Eremiobacterota bacterium]